MKNYHKWDTEWEGYLCPITNNIVLFVWTVKGKQVCNTCSDPNMTINKLVNTAYRKHDKKKEE